MYNRRKRFLAVNGLAIVVFVLAFLLLKAYVRYVNNHEVSYRMGDSVSTCSLEIVQSKYWSESAHGYNYGIQYDASMANLTNTDLRDWTAEISVPEDCRIDSFWNGEFTIEDGRIEITPVVYNKVIESKGSREVGFILYSNTLDNIQSFDIHFYKLISMRDLKLYWLMILMFLCGFLTDVVILVSEAKTKRLEHKKQEYQKIVEETFLTFASIIDAKDPYTRGHSLRVAIYSRELAKRMGHSEDEQEQIYYIALLHDIGKIGVPDAILTKKGKLTPEERKEIEQHVSLGGEILAHYTAIEGVAAGAKYHHERYDGAGYIEGLKGENIPLVARIICVADSFDAMTSNRCYRSKQSLDWVVEELKRCAGSQFDPKIVPYMLDMIADGKAPVATE